MHVEQYHNEGLMQCSVLCYPNRSTAMMTGVCWSENGRSFQVVLILHCGRAAGRFCSSGQKVVQSATASVGCLHLLHAQVGAECMQHI